MLEPYRSPDPPVPPPPEPVVELDEKQRLGVLRSVHRPLPLWRNMLTPVGLAVATFLLGLIFDPHLAGLAITTGPAAVLLLVLGAGPWRRRHLAVDVHARGVVVRTSERRDVILFEDVDALFWDLDVGSNGGKRQARIEGLRLVDHDGVTHHVPMLVDEPVEAVSWIQRHCSDHLLPDALASIRAGETLTFGTVRIDRDGIRFGRNTAARWKDIRVALLESGRICLFRRLPVIPWRRIPLDKIPHPTVFTRLVRELAPHVEIVELAAKSDS